DTQIAILDGEYRVKFIDQFLAANQAMRPFPQWALDLRTEFSAETLPQNFAVTGQRQVHGHLVGPGRQLEGVCRMPELNVRRSQILGQFGSMLNQRVAYPRAFGQDASVGDVRQ